MEGRKEGEREGMEGTDKRESRTDEKKKKGRINSQR